MRESFGFYPMVYREQLQAQFCQGLCDTKVDCVFPMVIVSLLPHLGLGRNDYGEDAFHFIVFCELPSHVYRPWSSREKDSNDSMDHCSDCFEELPNLTSKYFLKIVFKAFLMFFLIF